MALHLEFGIYIRNGSSGGFCPRRSGLETWVTHRDDEIGEQVTILSEDMGDSHGARRVPAMKDTSPMR